MKTLREAALLLLVAALPAALAVALHPELHDRSRAGLGPAEVRIEEAATWGESVVWVDAREAAAFARGHIPGALAFDENAFNESLGNLLAAWAPGRRVVVYCDSSACTRSRDVADRLRDAGLSDVYHLHGGWDAWTRARGQR